MSNLLRQQIGTNIKRLRVARGLTQEEAAREAGVTTRNWQRWEYGVVTPYYRNIVSISEVLEADPEEILGMNTASPDEGSLAHFIRELAVLEARVEELTAFKRDTERFIADLRAHPDLNL